MTRLDRLSRYFLFITVFVAGLLCVNPKTSAARLYIDIDSPSGAALPIAIVPLKPMDGAGNEAFRAFAVTLERDLTMTGLFRVLSPRSFLEPASSGIELDDTDFSLWKKTGADALVKGGFQRTGSGYSIEVRLFDVPLRQVIFGKRFTLQEDSVVRVAHSFADQIIQNLTGEAGIFADTRIACTHIVRGRKEIIELSLDGNVLSQVTNLRSISISPAWSRDGRFLAYTSYIGRNPDLYLFDRKRATRTKISARPGLNLGAAFNPKEDSLALAVSNDSDPEILVINTDGRVQRTLTNNFWIDIEPSWSPDGRSLAFVSSQSGQPHVYRMNRDGSEVQRLTYQGYHNVSPAWSPRGDKIAFAGRDEGNFDIFIMNSDGTSIQRLTRGEGNNEAPSFSPNGQMILFSSTRSGKRQLYIMGLDGRGRTQITDGIGDYADPAWSPRLK